MYRCCPGRLSASRAVAGLDATETGNEISQPVHLSLQAWWFCMPEISHVELLEVVFTIASYCIHRSNASFSFCPKLNCTFHAWGIKTPKPTPISAFESPTSAASLWMKASNSLSRGRCAQRHAFFSKDLLPGMETDQSGNTWSCSVATKKRPNWKSKRWRRTFQSLIKWRDTFLKGTV